MSAIPDNQLKVRPKVWLWLGVLASGTLLTTRPALPPVDVYLPEIQSAFLSHKGDQLQRDGRPFNGFVTVHYPDGRLQSRSQVAAGRLQGVSEGWHPNGVLQVREHFVAGVSHGLREKWHANGRLLSRVSIEGGKLNGEFKRWDEAGNLAETLPLKAGEPDGEAVAFHPSGFLKAVARFDRGQMVDQRFFADGERSSSGAERSGERR